MDNEAAKPNPALEPFSVLVGTWQTVGTHPLVPGTTLHGRTSFSWLAGGAFLVMQSQIEEPQIPSGIAIFGTDDSSGECSMLYFDERGVSRRYEVRMQDKTLTWWRNATDFSQRFTMTIERRRWTRAVRTSSRPSRTNVSPRADALPFEQRYWSGEHPALDPEEDPDFYPFPFHPLELGEAALLNMFDYQLEGDFTHSVVEPESIELLQLKRSRHWWRVWR